MLWDREICWKNPAQILSFRDFDYVAKKSLKSTERFSHPYVKSEAMSECLKERFILNAQNSMIKNLSFILNSLTFFTKTGFARFPLIKMLSCWLWRISNHIDEVRIYLQIKFLTNFTLKISLFHVWKIFVICLPN